MTFEGESVNRGEGSSLRPLGLSCCLSSVVSEEEGLCERDSGALPYTLAPAYRDLYGFLVTFSS